MNNYFKESKSVNTLPSRAYYIPFCKEDTKSYKREDSSRFTSLCGTWKIEAYESVTDAEEFWMKEGTNDIPVPSCVQYFGYDYMQYTNTRYPFAFDPPYIPTKNPAFHYSRYFDWNGENAYLVFEGVDSCFYVYVNGHFVGYSSISHKISEFDITPFIKEKDNKLDVLVLKWNKGSYLEDQDKWRLSGIFRDVYLLSRPKMHITDFAIKTRMDGTVHVENISDIAIDVLFNGEKKTVPANDSVVFSVKNPKLWSAEEPNLYEMEISANGEVIYQKIGICQSEIRDGIYLFNGKPIKLYGVNRHDFHPEKGYAVSYEDMKKDILLMKSMNVNALRTSHYPSSPLMYELCNEYGIYVMSESDLESHGTTSCGEPGFNYSKGMCLMSSSPLFTESILERQKCNFEEHKNFSCVNIYSIGNESGWGDNYDKALELWKSLTDKPIHYEGLWEYRNAGYEEEYYKVPIDMVSRMYPTTRWMHDEYLNDEKENRSLILCEYMHSMGNPGGMKEYWDVMENNDRFMGGYVWEWADHGMRYQTKAQRYGGDYGEFEHDGNFCIDGIVSTDREVRSATLAMKRAYQPVAFTYENGMLKAFNKNFFKTVSGRLNINGVGHQVTISPRESIEFKEDGDIVISYVENDKEVAMAQFLVNEKTKEAIETIEPVFTESGSRIIATIPNGVIEFDKDSGEVMSATINGELIGAIQFNIWRAPTDNDKIIKNEWKNHFLDHAKCETRNYEMDGNRLIFDAVMTVPCFYPLVRAKLTYSFTANGVVAEIDYEVTDKKYYDFIPRIGLKMSLDKAYSHLAYKAYGPYESYSDSYLHTIKTDYEENVGDSYHHYVKPQESGSHYLPDYVRLSNGKHTILAKGMQSFSALPYSSETLENTLHDEELPSSDTTYLCLDYCMSGMGTNACGPLPDEQYRVPFKGNGKIVIEVE